MGFHFNPVKAITRGLGIHDVVGRKIETGVNIVFPVHALSNFLVNKGIQLTERAIAPKHSNVTQSTLPQYFGQNPYNVSFQAPSYQAPYYGGGGGDPFSFQQIQPYGGSPWAYSTTYSQPSITPYQASSGRQDRSWEDLTSLAGAVLPFFL